MNCYQLPKKILSEQNCFFNDTAVAVMNEYIERRRQLPHFANARSIRNALDRARFRQAYRILKNAKNPVGAEELSMICAEDIEQSRIFTEQKKNNE